MLLDTPLVVLPQNYDLSISEAPKLFSDAEFEAVKRIQQALAVLLLRKRLKVINHFTIVSTFFWDTPRRILVS